MLLTNNTTKNFTEFGDSYQLVLPLSLEGLIPEDESVRLLSHELEELDYTLFYQMVRRLAAMDELSKAEWTANT